MFKAAKELRSSLSEIVCGCSIDKKVSSVCCEGNMRWNLKQRKYMGSEKKDGKAFRGQ